MPDLKARSGGQWSPAVGPPAVKAKAVSANSFARQVAAAWADNDAGGWLKINDLVPAQPTITASNNSGRIDLSWNIPSTNNLSKYQVWYSTDATNYYQWGTEPAANATSAVFGRVSPPVTYYFILRAVGLNGATTDSASTSVTIPGVSSFGFTHSRGSSGWHSRSFTFTASATSSSTITGVEADLYWRQNTSQNWSYVTSYAENNVSSMTKTYSFSSYDYGQRMFAVVFRAIDNQTRQNDGTTGAGYTYSTTHYTSELTATDISGGAPTISGSAPAVSNPGSPNVAPNTPNGYYYSTSNRSLSFVVGFDANVDRSEYDSAIIVLYNAGSVEVSRQTVDLASLKEQPWTRRELTYTFSSLTASTTYFAIFYVYDDEGADTSVSNTQITYDTQSSSYSYYFDTPTGAVLLVTDAGSSFFRGLDDNPNNTNIDNFVADAPYGAQTGYGRSNLRDDNNGTDYITTSIGSTGHQFQRVRFYRFRDFSINSSAVSPGSIGYRINEMRMIIPRSHLVYAQIFDRKRNLWLGYGGTDPSIGDYYIASNRYSGSWFLNLIPLGEPNANFEGVTTSNESGNNWWIDLDFRVVLAEKGTIGSLTNRLGMSSFRVAHTWYNKYDRYLSSTYYY